MSHQENPTAFIFRGIELHIENHAEFYTRKFQNDISTIGNILSELKKKKKSTTILQAWKIRAPSKL